MNTEKESVLIVDDMQSNLFVFKEALEDDSREIITAASGQEALKYLLKNQVDLILMDIQMPGLNGFETVQMIRGNPMHHSTPILFITAVFKSDEFMQYGFSVGAYDYITKPVDMGLLRNKAEVFLKLRRQQKALEELTEVLREHKEDLEKLVEKRTAELKEKQSQLIQASKLSSLGEMATGMAHELNTPLSVISLSAHESVDLLEDQEYDEISEVQQRIKGQVDRCAKIINHLRTFGRSDETLKQEILLQNILDDTLLIYGKKLVNQRITLEKDFQEELPPLHVNGNQVEQVLINLFNNAIDAMNRKDGSKIMLSARVLPEVKMMEICFSDNGPGMPEEVREKIFDPFYTTKNVGKGTGLGLSISHGIITSHNGTLECNSVLGEGTTFVMRLPIVDPTVDG